MEAIKLIDGYKINHRIQYPEGTEYIYSNLTPRYVKRTDGDSFDHVVVFGIQYLCQEWLIKQFNETFFNQDKDKVVKSYKRTMDFYLGKDSVDTKHIEALHDLGYLPIKIKALDEGTKCPIGVPLMTIENTLPEFFWLTNYLETLISSVVWGPITSATIAEKYYSKFKAYAISTGSPIEFCRFQGHDFSFRGISSPYFAAASGAAHLTSFVGTDTIPAIEFLEKYYEADVENELVGCSVPATEHSVMCLGEKESEIETFRRIINKVHPTGIVSIVSDTWDFWKVIGSYLPELKNEILARDGKVVIRPDSGDPVKIICGDDESSDILERKGLIECLWDIFGGSVNDKGYKVLDSHIGAIYGDSITLSRAEEILYNLKSKGFASCNIVFGIGSYTYQYNTRDTFGFAIKSTFGKVNGEDREIFKDPATDKDKGKKSARGKLKVVKFKENSELTLIDRVTENDITTDYLKTVFVDGIIVRRTSLKEIRERIARS